ncbi:MAG: hypothetical protein A2020_03370 [Lentisphaerae bacterium GWF2_45_14]|nr:MAG: hypothetical protein A2020_03370 [Lentisphaerae bacterium GWF2_45_14]
MIKDKVLKWTEIFAVLLAFLMPLKFGGLAAIPETTTLYLPDFFSWVLISWPTAAFSLFSGILLIMTTTLLPFPPGEFTPSFKTALLSALLALVSIVGIMASSCTIYAWLQILHLFGIAAFACAAFRLIAFAPYMKSYIVWAVIAGALLSSFEGLYQLLYGFEETKNFIYEQELRTGIKYASGNLKTRLSETRVFGFFSLCNSFAGHLILTIPLVFWGLCEICKKAKQPISSGFILITPVILFMLTMLYFTGSRAAVLALMLACGLCVIVFPFDRRLRIAGVIFGTVTLLAGIIYVKYSSRGFLSMTVRFDYFEAAWKIFMHNPLIGTGWGDFFHEYMNIKTVISDEAPHDPHNFILSFASQTGIAGLVVSTLFLFYPAFALLKAARAKGKAFRGLFSLEGMVFVGWTAWVLHALSDINIQVPGTIGTALVMVFAALAPQDNIQEYKRKPHKYLWTLLCIFIALSSIYGSWLTIKAETAFYELQELCDYRLKTPEEFSKISIDEVNRTLYRTVNLVPSSPFPWAAAADFMWMKKRPDLTLMYYKNANKLSPERPSFYFRLYLFNRMLGNYDEAAKNLKKAKELFPNNPQYKNESMH